MPEDTEKTDVTSEPTPPTFIPAPQRICWVDGNVIPADATVCPVCGNVPEAA